MASDTGVMCILRPVRLIDWPTWPVWVLGLGELALLVLVLWMDWPGLIEFGLLSLPICGTLLVGWIVGRGR